MQENEEIAETVRPLPCLYDKLKKQPKDKCFVMNAWKEVSDWLGFIKNSNLFILCEFQTQTWLQKQNGKLVQLLPANQVLVIAPLLALLVSTK